MSKKIYGNLVTTPINPNKFKTVSPTAAIEQTETGAVITIEDENGVTSATILNGKDGAQGPQGEKGEQGIQGETGPQGEKGEQGIQGEAGPQGEKGLTGADGADGSDGFSVLYYPLITFGMTEYDIDKLTAMPKVGDLIINMGGALFKVTAVGETTCTVEELADLHGKNGEDGVSATHSWDGTTLSITSASGTSSADLKGEKGDTGPQGPQGEQGEPGENGTATDEQVAAFMTGYLEENPDVFGGTEWTVQTLTTEEDLTAVELPIGSECTEIYLSVNLPSATNIKVSVVTDFDSTYRSYGFQNLPNSQTIHRYIINTLTKYSDKLVPIMHGVAGGNGVTYGPSGPYYDLSRNVLRIQHKTSGEVIPTGTVCVWAYR